MKKFISLLLACVFCIALCSCGEENIVDEPIADEPIADVPTTYKIGEAASNDTAEVVLVDVSYKDEYSSFGTDDEHTFVVVTYTLKNVGKTTFGYFPIYPNDGVVKNTKRPAEILWVDYNDGYVFAAEDPGDPYDVTYFQSPRDADITNHAPLSKEAVYEVAIVVPDEVIENTEAPLNICFNVLNSAKQKETFTFSVR